MFKGLREDMGETYSPSTGLNISETYPDDGYIITLSSGAVSYTHLDVYKRQPPHRGRDRPERGAAAWRQPVEGLLPRGLERFHAGQLLRRDVYKRQVRDSVRQWREVR